MSPTHRQNPAGTVLPERAPRKPGARMFRAFRRDLRDGGWTLVAHKAAGVLLRQRQQLLYRLNPRRLRYRLDRVEIDRPVFLLGTQGGGGTIIARCLQRHPKTVYASGNSGYWAGRNEIHNCPHLHDVPEPLVHRTYHFGTVDGRMEHHPRYGYQRAWLYAIDEFLPQYGKTAADVDPQTTRAFRRVLKKIILAYAHDPKDCRLVDQSQLFTIQVPYIRRMLEGCDPHFVLVARNPYATCARAVAKEYTAARGGHIEGDRDARIACAVEHWTNSYRLALDASREAPMISVKYEDFLDDPERIVREICRFAGLEFSSELIPAAEHRAPPGSVEPEKWYPLKRGENARYLQDLDGKLVTALNRRGAELIEALGYERMVPRS